MNNIAPLCSWEPSELLYPSPAATPPITVTIDDATVTA